MFKRRGISGYNKSHEKVALTLFLFLLLLFLLFLLLLILVLVVATPEQSEDNSSLRVDTHSSDHHFP